MKVTRVTGRKAGQFVFNVNANIAHPFHATRDAHGQWTRVHHNGKGRPITFTDMGFCDVDTGFDPCQVKGMVIVDWKPDRVIQTIIKNNIPFIMFNGNPVIKIGDWE